MCSCLLCLLAWCFTQLGIQCSLINRDNRHCNYDVDARRLTVCPLLRCPRVQQHHHRSVYGMTLRACCMLDIEYTSACVLTYCKSTVCCVLLSLVFRVSCRNFLLLTSGPWYVHTQSLTSRCQQRCCWVRWSTTLQLHNLCVAMFAVAWQGDQWTPTATYSKFR